MFRRLVMSAVRRHLLRGAEEDREIAHDRALDWLKWAQQCPRRLRALQWLLHPGEDSRLSQEFWGLTFPHPIGLAAGWDKNARVPVSLAACGFGFLEVGTVTVARQEGFPRPRLWVPEAGTLINRMGFPSDGLAAVREHLSKLPNLPVPLGISLGVSRMVSPHEAVGDLLVLLDTLYPFGDYFVLNFSSPNTPGLVSLLAREPLSALLAALQHEAHTLSWSTGYLTKKPLLVKVPPDLSRTVLDAVVDTCLEFGVEGIIATNTTVNRDGVPHGQEFPGGLSGHRLYPLALQTVQWIDLRAHGKLVIIGCGGISEWSHVFGMLLAGASLVQVFTSWTFDPLVVRQLVRDLQDGLQRHTARHVRELASRGVLRNS